jgi:sortase A
MTTVETPAEKTQPLAAASEPETTPAKTKDVSKKRVVVCAVAALALILVAWGAFAVFEGPIARSWYNRRQAALASQMASDTKHAGAGRAIAILQVPRLRINLVVAEGDTPQQLRSGPAHRTGTPMPGDIGNSVILGHRQGWGGPFKHLNELSTGDFIVVQVPPKNADQLPTNGVFKVVSVDRMSGNDLRPFAGATDRRLTLVTGTGSSSSDRRLVITAVSGPEGKVLPPPRGVAVTTSGGSSLWNDAMLLAVCGIGAAVLLAWGLRRRYSTYVVVAVVAPFAALGLLGLMLNVDAALPAVR